MEQQEKLLNKLKTSLPTNLIIVGPKYSGKKTLVSEIIDDSFVYVEGKVDNIRELSSGNYVFTDVDDWSIPCFSAMLSLLENNERHIIITCKNILNIPRPVISRCIVEHMEAYHNIHQYCENIGQIEYFSDEMLKDTDTFTFKEEYDLDVYFSVLCNRLLEQIKAGKDLTKEYLISSKYNAAKNLKSLNKKQFIVNWQLDLAGYTNGWMKL